MGGNLLVRVKLGYPPNFNFLGKPLLGEKYVHGKKERRKKKNNAKFSGHYVYPRTETVCAHALRSHQLSEKENVWSLCFVRNFLKYTPSSNPNFLLISLAVDCLELIGGNYLLIRKLTADAINK